MKKNILTGIVSFILLILFSAAAIIILPSDSKMTSVTDSLPSKSLSEDVKKSILGVNSDVNNKIFDLPPVYTLPMDLSPAPKPNPANYTDDTYIDDTISVKCWRERIELSDKTVTANFAEIQIAHPTQLRTAFSGGSYGTTKRTYASKMAETNNAVIAVNADFYNCRTEGLIIRQGTLYRKKPFGVDTLFIDENGDLSVMYDRTAVSTGYFQKKKIYQSIAFGPVLVLDGKAVKKLDTFNSIACGPRTTNPRTAIGQLGKLHYLICTIDGRSEESIGITTNQLAVIMADKKCTIAYNLDGGQSSTMIFNNKLYNVVSDGGERTMSDILYFATAIPESEWA